jgi:hypothetical protein
MLNLIDYKPFTMEHPKTNSRRHGETLHVKYWRSRFADLRGVELPTEYTRLPLQSFSASAESFQLPPEQTDQLEDCGKEERATLFVTLLTAFKVLVLRYCGREDIAVGKPIVNRICAETQCLIGFFVKTVVLDSFDSPTMRRMAGPFPHAARRDYCEP